MGVLTLLGSLLACAMILALFDTVSDSKIDTENEEAPHQELIDECIATFCLSEKYLYEYFYIRANHYVTSKYRIDDKYKVYTDEWQGMTVDDAKERMEIYTAIAEKGIQLSDSLIGLGVKSLLVDSILSFNQDILRLNKKENKANDWASLGYIVQLHYLKHHHYIDKMEERYQKEKRGN